MPRPNKPHWHEKRQQWRLRVRGKDHWLPRGDFGPQAWVAANAALHALLQADTTPGPATPPGPGGCLTLFDLRQAYLRWAEAEANNPARAMGKHQYRNHRGRLRKFIEAVGPDRDAADQTPTNLERFVADLAAKGHSVHYLRNICASVRAMYNWATPTRRRRRPSRWLPDSWSGLRRRQKCEVMT